MTLRAVPGDLEPWATRVGGPVLLTSRARRPGLAHEEVRVPSTTWRGVPSSGRPRATRCRRRCGRASPWSRGARSIRSPARAASRRAWWHGRSMRAPPSPTRRPERIACRRGPRHCAAPSRARSRSRTRRSAFWSRTTRSSPGASKPVRSAARSRAGRARRLLSRPRGRHRWEAAAAERGQTMAEWCAHAALDAVSRR